MPLSYVRIVIFSKESERRDSRTMRSLALFLVAVLTLAGIGDGLEWHGGVIDTILSLMMEKNEVG